MEDLRSSTLAMEASPSPATELGRRKLADVLYKQLSRLIARGEFPRNCKLPPEGELAQRFGVSRPVIRAALARLREEGVVRSQRGSGTVVVAGTVASAIVFPVIQSVADLLRSYEFRITVEVAIVSIAAERRNASDIANMRNALLDAENAIGSQQYHRMPDCNFRFHRAVAMSTHNKFYMATLELIPELLNVDQLETSESGGIVRSERMRRVHEEHVSICDAICDGDPVLASSQMRGHIQAGCDFVLEQQEITSWRD